MRILKYSPTVIVLICLTTSGCTSPNSTVIPSSVATETMLSPTAAPITPTPVAVVQHPSDGWKISDVIMIEKVSEVTGYTDYQYLTPDYDDPYGGEPAGVFWSVFSAMLQIEFRAHTQGGMEKLEDYRTAAMPGSVTWLESPLWDTGCFYYLDEWIAEISVVRGETCYFISFVPTAYPEFEPIDLATKLMEMFIKNSNV